MKYQLNSESEYKSELVDMVLNDMKIRECDIFNDDSAEIIEVKEELRLTSTDYA